MSTTRRQVLTGTAAVLAMGTVPAAANVPDDSEIYRLARECEMAHATWHRANNEVEAALDASAKYPVLSTMEEANSPLFTRFCDLERQVRTMPAKTLEGVLFKLRHLTQDCEWGYGDSGWYEPPVEQAIVDLERMVAGGVS